MGRRPNNNKSKNGANWFDDLIAEGLSRLDTKLTVIEFARDILGFNLMVPQSAVLKAFYGLPLDLDEEAWLMRMVAENKTTWRPGRLYQELVVEAGMRSSKTTIASVIVSYEAFELYQLADPAGHYGLHPGSPIFITTVATTQQQSKDTVFGYTKARVEDSPYFQTLIDKGEIIVNEERIEFPKKRITIIGGHSNQAGMVGKTAKAFVMDEAARFKDTSTGESNAKSMYSNVGRSTISFKGHGRKVIISSAWEEGDVMEWLYEMADPDLQIKLEDGTEIEQNMLAFRLCTWDLNTSLTRKDFVNEYRMDEVAARRDYEGIRPGSVENFFVKEKLVQAATGESCAQVQAGTLDVGARTYVSVSVPHVEPITFPLHTYAHADPGLKKDSFGFACGHPVRTPGGILVVIDLVLEWQPKDRGKGVVWPVSYEDVERVIQDVHKARNFRRLTFDHWQSAGLTQRLYSKGIVTQEIHFSGETQLAMYQCARQKFNAGLVILPKDADKLLKELIHIQLLRGKKIDHPRKNPDETPGCFTGDTRVSLLDGRELNFKELVSEFGDGRPFYVYAVDPDTQQMQVGEAYNPRLTKHQAEIVAVTLDNGEVVRCTPDHRFMLRDGSWCAAQDLKPNASLMPLYRETTKKGKECQLSGWKQPGYEVYLNPRDQKYYLTHWMVGEFKYGDTYRRGRGHGLVLHHDKGKRNNDPTALILMTSAEHASHHAKELKLRRADPVIEERRRTRAIAYAQSNEGRQRSRSNLTSLWEDPEYRKKMQTVIAQTGRQTGPANITRYNKSEKHATWAQSDSNVSRLKAFSLPGRDHPAARKDITIEQIIALAPTAGSLTQLAKELKCAVRTIRKILSEHNRQWKDLNVDGHQTGLDRKGRPKLTIEQILAVSSGGESVSELARRLGRARATVANVLKKHQATPVINHKVVSVVSAGFEDVYDISVRGWENFALTAGVFVHNSKDLADCVASVIYQCAEEERLYATTGSKNRQVQSIGKTHVADMMGNAARTRMRDIRFLTQ